MKRFELFFGLMRIPLDFLAVYAALLSAYVLRAQIGFLPRFLKQPDLETFPALNVYIQLALLGAALFILFMSFGGAYRLKKIEGLGVQLRQIIVGAFIWLMSIITYYFLIRGFPFSRLVLFYGFAFLIAYGLIGRLALRAAQTFLLSRGIGLRRILLVGESHLAQKLARALEREGRSRIVARAASVGEAMATLGRNRLIEEVIMTVEDNADELIGYCRERHLAYHFVPTVREVYLANVELAALEGIPLISLRPTPLDGWGRVLKRTFDLLVSTIALIILLPFFIIIAIAVKLDSRGPIFFRTLDDGSPALRIGEKGRSFICLKFRTMQIGTHGLRYTRLADRNIRKNSPLVKIKDDPRVTRFGRLLRRFSLDELPQLLNVIAGTMSLVGPRPHLSEEVAKYAQHQKFVLAIKPGITGLAQVSGRSDLPFDEEVRLDTSYIEHWSLRLDIKILLKTILVVLRPYME